MSQRNKEECKACDIPFPIKSLQERYMITVNNIPNREWLIVSLYELERSGINQTNWGSFVYYKHGGKDGKGATKRLWKQEEITHIALNMYSRDY